MSYNPIKNMKSYRIIKINLICKNLILSILINQWASFNIYLNKCKTESKLLFYNFVNSSFACHSWSSFFCLVLICVFSLFYKSAHIKLSWHLLQTKDISETVSVIKLIEEYNYPTHSSTPSELNYLL